MWLGKTWVIAAGFATPKILESLLNAKFNYFMVTLVLFAAMFE